MTSVLFAPHSDDETLFAFYTMKRHQPRLVICFPSERDYGATALRHHESRQAMRHANVYDVDQWMGGDEASLVAQMRAFDAQFRPAMAWAPHEAASHPHHVTVARAAAAVFGSRLQRYHTYDAGGKVRAGQRVAVEDGWPEAKRKALACYQTQVQHPRARVFYDEAVYELDEYAEDTAAVVTVTGPMQTFDPPVPVVLHQPVPILTKRAAKRLAKKAERA